MGRPNPENKNKTLVKRIAFLSANIAGLIDNPEPLPPLQPDEVRGRTLVSLTSPGTETSLMQLVGFPFYPGYAAVFQVDEVGGKVTGISAGDKVFGSGPHQEIQTAASNAVAPLPPSLDPKIAVFARLAGVSMSTLNTTTARPPSRVLVTGLGPIGNLAAQIWTRCGYEVTGIDPAKPRRDLALQSGIADVRASIDEGPSLEETVTLALECSGHEQAILDACRCVRKRGEVVMVGRNWKQYTALTAHDLLEAVFKRYAVLRSGWEWEVPLLASDFHDNSLMANYAAALRWLAEGSLKVHGFAETFAPEKAREAYAGLLDRSSPAPCAIFDWEKSAA